jgi:hypothetical protein
MDTNLQKLIDIIKSGSPSDVKLAQKEIEKIWHDTCRYDKDRKESVFCIFLEELKSFPQIKDVDHQAYFINTLKWPLYFIGEKYFSDWSDFILTYIQHPSGKVRQAIIRVSDYLLIDLQMDFKHASMILKNKDLKHQDIKDIVADDKKKFGDFVLAIENLVSRYYEPRFKKYKYVDSLPISVYKSLQMLLVELLKAEFYKKIYQDFLKELDANRGPRVSSGEILNIRQQIDERLEQVIKKTGGDLKLNDIKNIIYNESGQEDIQKIVSSFSDIQDFNELQQLISLVMDAWNYWPHKNLNGLAPVERL